MMKRFFILLLCAASLNAAAVSSRIQNLMQGAEQGKAWDQLNLGAAYDNGMDGLPVDAAKAVYWYEKSAQQNVAEAQFNLAHCLVTGHGTSVDLTRGFAWMEKAAQNNIIDAQFLLGVMYIEEMGNAGDKVKAKFWLNKAASGGNSDAKALLLQIN